jgi:glycosyltransferase involved in cell wall biosynthesis
LLRYSIKESINAVKIGFLVGHPTQFEGPFFQYAARDNNHDIRVIYSEPDCLKELFDPELGRKVSWGIDLLNGYSYELMPKQARLRWLLKNISAQKYDLLIINGYSRSEYLFAAVIAKLKGTPAALRLDSVAFANTSPVKRLAKKIGFVALKRFFRHFFAIGSLTVEYLEHYGVKRDRISVFSYVVDDDYFRDKSRLSSEAKCSIRERYGIDAGSRIILSVTKFNQRESPWDLMRAYRLMPDNNSCLLLIGDGEQRAALEEYASVQRNRHIIFAGYVPYQELPSLYGIADVFVHAVRNEPWGVSVNEALACGLPVVASSTVGAAYDLISSRVNGAIYEAGDPNDLRDKLNQMLSCRREDVRSENDRVLSTWNYETSWRNVLEVGRKNERVRV